MKQKVEQCKLFESTNNQFDWQKEWVDMPEFIQNKQDCYCKIIVRFENETDLENFSKLINQKLTKKTKSIWFPFKSHWQGQKKIYINEE